LELFAIHALNDWQADSVQPFIAPKIEINQNSDIGLRNIGKNDGR